MLPSRSLQARAALYPLIGIIAVVTASSWLNGQAAPPPTERQDVTEVFYGQSVTDPYRWLENWHDA